MWGRQGCGGLQTTIGPTIPSQWTDKHLSVSSGQWKGAGRWANSCSRLTGISLPLPSELPQATDTAKQGGCRSRGGDVSRIQGLCLLHWNPKAETSTKYSQIWSSHVHSSRPPLLPSLLKPGAPNGGWGSDPPGTKAFGVSQAKLPLLPRLQEAPPHRGPHLSPSSQRTASGRPPLSQFCPGREFPGSSRSALFPRTATEQAKKPESAAASQGAEPDGPGKARHPPSSAPTCRPSWKPSPGESACEDKHRFGGPALAPASPRRRRDRRRVAATSAGHALEDRQGARQRTCPARPDLESGRRLRFHPSLWGIDLSDWANKKPQPTLWGLRGGRHGVLRHSDGIEYSASSKRFIFLFHPGPQPAPSPKPGDS